MRTEDLIFHAHQNLLHSAWIVLNGSAAIKRVLKEQDTSCILRDAPNIWPDSLQKTEQDLVMEMSRSASKADNKGFTLVEFEAVWRTTYSEKGKQRKSTEESVKRLRQCYHQEHEGKAQSGSGASRNMAIM